jgi:signal transduction histidine kinase
MTPSPYVTPESGNDTEALLFELFPFIIVTDASLTVHRWGPLAGVLAPELKPDQSLLDTFELHGVRQGDTRIDPVTWRSNRSVMLKHRQSSERVLKGQLQFHGESTLYFLGWPVVTRADDLVTLGVKLRDIPPHNHLSDLLLVLRNSQLTLADADRLTQKARERSRELEALNDRLRGEAELVRARQAAEAASDAKSRFLSHVSHELRTPMNAILGYSEMLVDGYYGAIPQTAIGVLDRMQVNGRHLLDLINKILDMSVIEAGQLTLSIATYDFRSTCEKVVAATEGLATQKGLGFFAKIDSGVGNVTGDELRVTQVIINLIGNAIKFTTTGSVTLAVCCEGESVVVEVRDTGPGIAPQDQARIFKDFQQVKLPGGVTVGAGLGLSIASKIVALHGGRMEVESRIGEGSTFRVTLPINISRVEHKE